MAPTRPCTREWAKCDLHHSVPSRVPKSAPPPKQWPQRRIEGWCFLLAHKGQYKSSAEFWKTASYITLQSGLGPVPVLGAFHLPAAAFYLPVSRLISYRGGKHPFPHEPVFISKNLKKAPAILLQRGLHWPAPPPLSLPSSHFGLPSTLFIPIVCLDHIVPLLCHFPFSSLSPSLRL